MSGADKRKLAKEKDKKNTEIISKTRRMTEFFITQPNTTSSSSEHIIIKYMQSYESALPPQLETIAENPSPKNIVEETNESLNLDIGLWPENMTGLIDYWAKRLVSVITFICERGLALRGKNETVGSSKNGNYLGILELIAEYDNFLKRHIENHANRESGHTDYLSSTICEELIEIMGNNVLNEIISRIKLSKYFSISLDSTPDEGHIDQLTLVFRYIEKDTPVERFLVFMPNQGHKAQDMYDGLINFLNKYDLNIKNCRGQS
ncbi:uncharacterized protein LOC136092089 [Hydra vulgaris]|uniref:Uncharacterized protein LOC136092089 n=1 Tax=Hydra vulgaris TaxID=6087 RepID=A0ABM4DMT0_HYDVU